MVLAPSIWIPPALKRVSRRARRYRERPGEYEFKGVRFRAVRGLTVPIPAWRWRVSPSFPALTTWWHRTVFGDRLISMLRDWRPDTVLLHDAMVHGSIGARIGDRLGVPYSFIERDAFDMPADSTLGRWYPGAVRGATAVFNVGLPYVEHMRDVLGVRQAVHARSFLRLPDPASLVVARPERWAGRFVVLSVGTFIERKAHKELIQGFARAGMDDGVLVCITSDPEAVLSIAEREGVRDRVEAYGSTPHPEVLQYMAWADVFALPSWWEALGMVYAEAMACETPVILSSDSGFAREIVHGEHGWVIPPKDVEAISRALVSARSADVRSMGRAGRTYIIDRFDWDRNAESMVRAMMSGSEDTRGET